MFRSICISNLHPGLIHRWNKQNLLFVFCLYIFSVDFNTFEKLTYNTRYIESQTQNS